MHLNKALRLQRVKTYPDQPAHSDHFPSYEVGVVTAGSTRLEVVVDSFVVDEVVDGGPVT